MTTTTAGTTADYRSSTVRSAVHAAGLALETAMELHGDDAVGRALNRARDVLPGFYGFPPDPDTKDRTTNLDNVAGIIEAHSKAKKLSSGEPLARIAAVSLEAALYAIGVPPEGVFTPPMLYAEDAD